MSYRKSFGDCLNEILILRGWSASKLGREIYVDSSYVQKWVRGERVPSLQSDYIDKISNALSFGLNDKGRSLLSASLNDECRYRGVDADNNMPLPEIIAALLKTTQIISLSPHTVKRDIKTRRKEKDILNVLHLLTNKSEPGGENTDRSSVLYEFSIIPAYLEGREQILKAALSILNVAALDAEAGGGGELFITFQSQTNCFDGYASLYILWADLVAEILKKGWNIYYLYRLDRNVHRTLKLVGEIVDLARYSNQFYPVYFSKYGTVSPPSELFIAKNVGALMCFSAGRDAYIDRAFFYRRKDAVQALYDYAASMCCETDSLLKPLPSENDFHEFITSKDRKPGDFYSICPDLYMLTIPLNLWEKYLKRSLKNNKDIELHMGRIKERINIFHEDVKRYKVRLICPLRALEHMAGECGYLHFNRYQAPEADDILEHLNNILNLLKTYNNFEIAFIGENQLGSFPDSILEVKSRSSVVISTKNPEDSHKNVCFAITEETIAEAFHDYFLGLWERIVPVNRDKECIIRRIQEYIRHLR